MIVKLCDLQNAPPDGNMKAFSRGSLQICLANDNGFFAFDNRCPHQNGPLSEGTLDHGIVVCPYHAWRFDIRTGSPEVAGDPPLACFEVRQYGDELFIQLPDDPS